MMVTVRAESVEQQLALIKYRHARSDISVPRPAGPAPHPSFCGLTLVSCEKGDIRQSAHGVYIYGGERDYLNCGITRSLISRRFSNCSA